jgi:demethylmenaquinone methyltransferase/2-methoxy-6-polyprenyl-1,4-benzoquinol methylase
MLVWMLGSPGEDRSGAEEAYVAESLAAQKHCYELRAPEYGSWTKPSDRVGRGLFPSELAETVIADLRPFGDVLELACGPGPLFTNELARHAHTVTAVDASTAALRLNQQRVANSKVTYLQADLFDWSPPRTYDFVFFGHWLSHIPRSRFDTFWDRVSTCTGDHGRVGFIDEDERAADFGSRPPVRTPRRGAQDAERRSVFRHHQDLLGTRGPPTAAEILALGHSDRTDSGEVYGRIGPTRTSARDDLTKSREVPFPSVSDPGLDGLETHPVSLRPLMPRNDGSGRAAPLCPCPRMRVHIDVGHRPEVPVGGTACASGPSGETPAVEAEV